MAIHRINLTTVSWISRAPLGLFALPKLDWLHQLCFGMFHTANPEPPAAFSGQYVNGRTLGQQYRGLMSCNLELDVDARGAFQGARSVDPAPSLDPGFTPRFDDQRLAAVGAFGQSVKHWDPSLDKRILDEAGAFHAGESSTLSHVALPPPRQWQRGGIKPLPYGTLTASESEIVLAHGILKFRAGAAGDRLGILAFGAPNHVPWVWCEAMLCYAHHALKLYCAGSLFPSHNYYVDGSRRATIQQVSAPSDLQRVFESGKPALLKKEFQWSAFPIHVVTGDQSPRGGGATTRIPLPRQMYTVAAQHPKTVIVPLL